MRTSAWALAIVLVASNVGWGALSKINVVRDVQTNTYIASITWQITQGSSAGSADGSAASSDPCADVLIAIVVGASQRIEIVSVIPAQAATADKGLMDPDQQGRLAAATASHFDVGSGELAYLQLDIPDPCPSELLIEVRFQVFAADDVKGVNPLLLPGDTFRAGSSDVKELSSDLADRFDWFDLTVSSGSPDGIPATSSWGLLALGLVLLVAARVSFGGRPRSAAR